MTMLLLAGLGGWLTIATAVTAGLARTAREDTTC